MRIEYKAFHDNLNLCFFVFLFFSSQKLISAQTRTADARTSHVIQTLQRESPDDSLHNLDQVSLFFEPGFRSEYRIPDPLNDFKTILSNRRFSKILSELTPLGAAGQYEKLQPALRSGIQDYILLLLSVNTPDNSADDRLPQLFQIYDNPDGSPTGHGITIAIRSLVTMAALLGNAEMWPDIRAAFRHPDIGVTTDSINFNPRLRGIIAKYPLFDREFQVVILLTLAQNIEPEKAKEYGFPVGEIRQLAAEANVKYFEHKLVNYQSRVSAFEQVLRMRPVDYSQGFTEIKLPDISTEMGINKAMVALHEKIRALALGN